MNVSRRNFLRFLAAGTVAAAIPASVIIEPKKTFILPPEGGWVVRKRRLKGNWTVEALQDLEVQHGINLEREIFDMLKLEIQKELRSDEKASTQLTQINRNLILPTMELIV